MTSLIDDLIRNMNIRIDSGISIEMNVFLREQENVKSYSIAATEDGKYEIAVEVNDFSHSMVNQLFRDFVRFMEFSCCTYYERRVNEDSIDYVFVSTDKNGFGFCCQINYS